MIFLPFPFEIFSQKGCQKDVPPPYTFVYPQRLNIIVGLPMSIFCGENMPWFGVDTAMVHQGPLGRYRNPILLTVYQ